MVYRKQFYVDEGVLFGGVRMKLVDRILYIALVPAVFAALYFTFLWSPVERQMGVSQKIFYFHLGYAWVAFLAFFVVGFYSVLTLIKPTKDRYICAGVSGEIGVLFTTIALISGMIWGRTAWNTWWSWDPRLTTTLILWFIYIAFIFIRKMEGPWEKIARLSSVFGIIGCLNVPIVFMAIRWWNSKLQPILFTKGPAGNVGGLPPEMLFTLLFTTLTLTLLYIVLLRKGMEIEKMRFILQRKKQKVFDQFISS